LDSDYTHNGSNCFDYLALFADNASDVGRVNGNGIASDPIFIVFFDDDIVGDGGNVLENVY